MCVISVSMIINIRIRKWISKKQNNNLSQKPKNWFIHQDIKMYINLLKQKWNHSWASPMTLRETVCCAEPSRFRTMTV